MQNRRETLFDNLPHTDQIRSPRLVETHDSGRGAGWIAIACWVGLALVIVSVVHWVRGS